MKKLLVRYQGWGESWPLGQLADDGRQLLFEYSKDALRAGLELSPLRLPVRSEAYGDNPGYLLRLPGLISDSLPDGWGLLLMDRYFRRLGLEPATLSPLDRLSFLGDRALGALTFEPADTVEPTSANTTLIQLAQEVTTVLTGKDVDVLRRLLVLGGSPHGERPKVLVGYDATEGSIRAVADPKHRPYLVKFPAKNEHKEVCAIEHSYCETARACGIEVTQTQYFELGRSHAAFGIARFDIEGNMRVPIHTLAGALHADFRVPSVDYISLLRTTRAFTGDDREVLKAYERAIFNVLFNNRDDHSKNFAFRLDRDRRWRLAPAYDLTFNVGPGGEHQMDLCGEARRVTRAHLLELAAKGGIKPGAATEALERMLEQVGLFGARLQNQPIRRNTVRTIVKAVNANCAALHRR
ncbi:MAG: serine/threonine-protein kinase HipA [Gammaproteobacteria bacterium]|nr:serine/threonine-protein kinase HipA [Gammaproteobacteria bacterium]